MSEQSQFEKFSAVTRKVLKMSYEQLKAKLDAEKKVKAKKKSRRVNSKERPRD